MNKFKVGDVVVFNHTTLNSYKFWEVVGSEGDRVDVLGLYNHMYENQKVLGFVLRTSEELLEKVTKAYVDSAANEYFRLITRLYAAFGEIEAKRLKNEQKADQGSTAQND